MVRTQIYLTEKEKSGLGALSRSTGKKQAELIREAVDFYIEQNQQTHASSVLNRAKGLWKDRTDLPDFETTRRSLDRS